MVQGSYEIGPAAQPGGTRVRRSFATKPDEELPDCPAPGVLTVWDVMTDSLKRDPARKCVGWRDIVDTHIETKMVNGQEKKWTFFELSPYKWLDVKEYHERITKASCGLTKLGLVKADKFNIYAATAVSWQTVSYACQRISVTVCTAYETLGKEGLQHSLTEPEVKGVFTNGGLLASLAEVINNCPTVKYVIYDGEGDEAALTVIKAVEGITVMSLEELSKLGEENPSDPVAPTQQDVACIMYTSGSTGSPKGVVLTHRNLMAAVASIWKLVGHLLNNDDVIITYLPLAHILAFVIEIAFFWGGVGLGYARVKTLTDASVRNCSGDIKELRPTILVGVPAVWEQIRKGILAKVDASSRVKKALFYGALSAKTFARTWNIPAVGKVLDAVVFKAIKEGTGNRLRYGLSGGAAVSAQTQTFISNSIMPLLQGFGLTESCGMCTILTPEFLSTTTIGTAGNPVPSIEVKLIDHAEAGYLSTNKPQQGEILIRGPSVTKGYYKREDADKEAFTSDGWFRTGDIGQWNLDGTLSIIDRLKNLVKLPGGEYIALEKLESSYKSCGLIGNICVHVEPDAKQAIAVIFPHEHNLKMFAQNNGLKDYDHLEDAVHDQQIKNAILKEVNSVGKKAGFKPMESLGGVVLTAEEWTPESGLVTAAQKINRSNISKHFRKEIIAASKPLMV